MTPITACPPDRSIDQRRSALATANTIRSARADLKRNIKTGEASVTDALRNPPEWLGTCKVYELLLAVPKLGTVKAKAALKHTGISTCKTVGGLSAARRAGLVDYLEAWQRPAGRCVAPATSKAQVMAALSDANVIRHARRKILRDVAAGTLTAAAVILEPPAEAERLPIGDLLIAQRRWGVHRVDEFLDGFEGGMSERKTLGSLTDRQRRALAAQLCGRADMAMAA